MVGEIRHGAFGGVDILRILEAAFARIALCADRSAAPKPVQVTMTAGDLALVTGVAAGDQVVVEGQNQLRPGAKIAAADAPNQTPNQAPKKP